MKAWDILRCPKTGNKLLFENNDSVVKVENSDITYPVIDGIIDFCGRTNDLTPAAYDRFVPRYDEYITAASLPMKLWSLLVWGSVDDSGFTEKTLSYMPDTFDGILLDVPAGTGIFTESLYAKYPDATIIAADYSMKMLKKAKNRFTGARLTNVLYIRADVANLPLAEEVVDIVLCMNGLHAFKDKTGSIKEITRVLGKNGLLVLCGYIIGVRRLSDFFVKTFGAKRGFFNPPFYTAENIGTQFEGFEIIEQGNIKSGAYLKAQKK